MNNALKMKFRELFNFFVWLPFTTEVMSHDTIENRYWLKFNYYDYEFTESRQFPTTKEPNSWYLTNPSDKGIRSELQQGGLFFKERSQIWSSTHHQADVN